MDRIITDKASIREQLAHLKIVVPDALRKKFLGKKACVIGSGGLFLADICGFFNAMKENNLLPDFKWYFGSLAGSIVNLTYKH